MALKDVEVALTLKRELDIYDTNRDRSLLIKALRDQFLIARQCAAIEVEKKRLLALEVLINRVTSMSDSMLIRAIELLSDMGKIDLERGGPAGPAGPGQFVNVQQLGISMGNQGGNPVKDTGDLLEALEHIGNHFRGKTIDLEANKDKKD